MSKDNVKAEMFVPNVAKIVGEEGLNTIRSLKELHPFLPVKAGGLTVKSALSKDGKEIKGVVEREAFLRDQQEMRDALVTRTTIVSHVATSPQMGEIGRRYDPLRVKEYITKLLKKKHAEDPLDPVLYEFEGITTDPFTIPFGDKGKGHTTPLHLVEQMINMGPTGNEFKRGAEPCDPDLYELAIGDVIRDHIKYGITDLKFSHAVLCTEDSTGNGTPMATLRDKSAGWPAVLDMKMKPRKGNHIRQSLYRLRRIMRKSSRTLLMYPGVVYKRFDRTLRLALYYDDSNLGEFNREARDRAIVAQSFPSQISEAIALRPLSKATQRSSRPNYALRTPYHTSAELKNMDALSAKRHVGELDSVVKHNRFLMGLDTSHWDQQVPPQFWYGFLKVTLALYKPTQRVGTIYSDEFVIFDEETQRRLEALAPGSMHNFRCRVRVPQPNGSVIEEEREYFAEMFDIDAETYIRRVFAGISGNDIVVGDIQFSGYKHNLTSPDGKTYQVGWGQRSGNWSTFLGNCVMNDIIDPFFERMVMHQPSRMAFKQEFGYELPTKFKVLRSLIAGDDKVVLVELDPVFASLVYAGERDTKSLCADMLTMIGQKVNAKKQEGSGVMGPGYAGFAQMLVYKGKVITRIMDLFDKMFWRESDEATGIDPLTGRDYRHLIGDLGNHARIANTSGSFGRDPHPWLEEALGVIQDLDIPDGNKANRMLPPEDSEEREILTRLYNARMARRGQAPHGATDLVGFWDTPGPLLLEERFTRDQSKLSGPWNPIVKGRPPKDARSEWRKR